MMKMNRGRKVNGRERAFSSQVGIRILAECLRELVVAIAFTMQSAIGRGGM